MKRLVAPLGAALVLGAAAFAFLHEASPAPAASASSPTATPVDTPAERAPHALPPNHPPISPTGSANGLSSASADEGPAITWKVPPAWQTAPNPNAMRIATYHPSPSTEVTVSRAGGATEANFQRWIGQFDEAGKDTRTEMTVHDLKIELVEVSGTYLGGGMMTGPAAEKHAGWMLVGAVVETPGSHYFFKLLGPAGEVRAARASFDAVLASIAPR